MKISFPRMSLVLTAGIFAVSASSVFAQATPKAGGTLVMAFPQTPRHLNSAVQSGVATAVPAAQLFASPLRFDDKWNPQPYLAESWKLAEDGKSLTLNLRKDAVFHDGKPITSTDVAFSLMAVKKNHPFDSMLGPLEKVDTPDAHTAVLRMSRPHPAIVLAMSPALAPILPKHIYDGKDLKNHPRNSKDVVGSGPFKLVAFEPGRRVLLEKFDKFFIPGRPYLDKLVIDVSPDATSTLVGFERGTIQMMPFFSNPTEIKRLESNKQIAITPKGYEGIGGMNWLAFNLKDKAFADVRVRKAFAYAVDMNFINKALYSGYSQSADGPIVPSSPYFSKTSVVTYPVDLKKSAALLDEAGFKVGADKTRMKVVLDYVPGAGSTKTLAEYLRAQLKKVDVAVEVRTSADFPSWAKRMADHDFQMSIDTVFNWGDPVIGVHRTYLSSNIKNQVWTNTQSYSNKQVDALLEQAGQEMDPAKRKAQYAEFQKIVTDEVPIRFLNLVPYHTLSRINVGNVPTNIWGTASPLDEVFLK